MSPQEIESLQALVDALTGEKHAAIKARRVAEDALSEVKAEVERLRDELASARTLAYTRGLMVLGEIPREDLGRDAMVQKLCEAHAAKCRQLADETLRSSETSERRVAEEREACAVLAGDTVRNEGGAPSLAKCVEDAIRARGSPVVAPLADPLRAAFDLVNERRLELLDNDGERGSDLERYTRAVDALSRILHPLPFGQLVELERIAGIDPRDDAFHDAMLAACGIASQCADKDRIHSGTSLIGAVRVIRMLAEMRGLKCKICNEPPMPEDRGGGIVTFRCKCGFTESGPSAPLRARST